MSKPHGDFSAGDDAIDLDARRGRLLALLGTNGTGKTTPSVISTSFLKASVGATHI
jgi:ABC-type Na+ transport system ATPase subunit NatA